MRIGYFDCCCGVSGDMCLGAVVAAGVPLETIESALRTLPLEGWSLAAETVQRAGLAAVKVTVHLDETAHHPHRGLSDVLAIIAAGSLPGDVAERSAAVFRKLADAEARVHGTTPEHVHFHEVGAVDAICDIVGTVVGLHELKLDALLHSTIAVGGGTVTCAHGTLPVPAPAASELLKGLPIVGGPVDVELATPTGVALLQTLAEPSVTIPAMTPETVGCGAGGRDLDGVPNVLRLTIGQSTCSDDAEADAVWILETNLDDMTGEQIAFCAERLFERGALDVFTTPVLMKKGRPGVVLSALCDDARRADIERLIFEHTSTFGVRRTLWQRTKLARSWRTVETQWGPVRMKIARLGGRELRCEPEYEDCRALAEANDVPLSDVQRAARSAVAT